MKHNDIYRASAKLEEAVAVTRNRHERTRYAYILGQLYEAQNRHDAAFAAFEKAKHGSPNFEMEFNAQLYEINHDHATGKASASEALSRCRAMLREAKNDDYADQIYYTMGKISLVEKDEPAALAFMRRGLMQPKATKPHKAEIYYTLAETFWKNERFALAKHYYDSTALNLEKTDPRLATVTKRAADLADIATHIETVELNDSLLRVAAMSDADRRALGKRILANEAKSKRAKALAEINAKLNEAAADRVTGIEGPNKAQFEPKALDSWWAYDEPTRKKQTRDFERKFGKRKLEDDWLRSQRKGANQTIDVDTTTTTTSVAAVKNGKDSSATAANKASRNPNAKAKPLREEDREADEVFKDIPRTPEAIAAARGKIAEALAKLGDLYRLRLALPKRSADTDEDLLARFADKSKPYEREVFFTLFQDYTDLRNPAKADVYKQKLIGAYPESSLAKSLTNPAFATEQKQQAAALDTYYAETLRLKESGNAAAAAERIGKVDSLFGNAVKGSPLAPKFALLSAFCVGALNGKEAYIGALQKVVAGFPKTPEEARATEILGYLSGVAKPEPASVKAETVSYKSDLAGEHYILIWVKDAGAKLGDLKTAVGDYDRKYYNIRNLTVQVLTLDAKTIFAVVRRFDDDVTAKAYATQALSKTKEFTGSAVTSYAVMPISQANYTLLVQSRDLAQYASFAEKAYQMNVNK